MTKVFNTPFKTNLQLKRYPHRAQEVLQAWDSADELILEHLSSTEYQGKKILILNDGFGALSCALEDQDITTYADSYLSHKAIQLNSQGRVQPVSRLDEISGTFDIVLTPIPKNMSFFEDMLCHVSHHLHPGSKIICGYMIKHQAKASFELLNQLIGVTRTTLAQKKARLILASFERAESVSPYPLQILLEGFKQPFVNHSNLFSREKLDIGTRFLLEHIPKGPFKKILDLGCANGVIGIAAKVNNPQAELIFSDESQMAILSARANYEGRFSDPARFVWTNCYEKEEPFSVDLVLCNPPFHQGNTVGDFAARQMFKDAHHALTPGGRLRIVGNSHLKYSNVLKNIFGNSEIVAKNAKFTIVDAVKPS